MPSLAPFVLAYAFSVSHRAVGYASALTHSTRPAPRLVSMPQPKAAQTLEQKFDQNCHPFYDLGFEHVRETMHGMELRLQGLRGELAATAKEARARQGELQAVNARLEAATTETESVKAELIRRICGLTEQLGLAAAETKAAEAKTEAKCREIEALKAERVKCTKGAAARVEAVTAAAKSEVAVATTEVYQLKTELAQVRANSTAQLMTALADAMVARAELAAVKQELEKFKPTWPTDIIVAKSPTDAQRSAAKAYYVELRRRRDHAAARDERETECGSLVLPTGRSTRSVVGACAEQVDHMLHELAR